VTTWQMIFHGAAGDLHVDSFNRISRAARESKEGRSTMSGWVALGSGMAGFAVGLFVHAIPASWWPRWLRELVGKKE
jgi:hypothetical protein